MTGADAKSNKLVQRLQAPDFRQIVLLQSRLRDIFQVRDAFDWFVHRL